MNRKEVLECAKEVSDNVAVAAILVAINEAKSQLDIATWQLHVRSGSAMSMKEANTYYTCGSFLEEAGRYEAAAARLETLFLTLVITLQGLGAKIEY